MSVKHLLVLENTRDSSCFMICHQNQEKIHPPTNSEEIFKINIPCKSVNLMYINILTVLRFIWKSQRHSPFLVSLLANCYTTSPTLAQLITIESSLQLRAGVCIVCIAAGTCSSAALPLPERGHTQSDQRAG